MKYNNHGVTLIELLVALAIFGMVITAGYSLFIFGIRTFVRGEHQFELQSNLRLAHEVVKNELRNSTEIEIIEVNLVPSNDNVYGYLYIEDDTLKHRSSSTGFTVINRTLSVLNTSAPVFTIEEINTRYILTIDLNGSLNSSSYNTSTEIFLKNIKEVNPGSGYAIKYK